MNSKKAYVIVSRDGKSIFGRVDSEFYGAIWFYPDRAQAEGHCGGAGMVIEIEVTFPDDVSFNLPIKSPYEGTPYEGTGLH